MTVKHTEFSVKKPPQLVYLELGNGNGGMLLSLSEEGFRFRAVTPVRAAGNVPFAFSLDGSRRFEGSGSIEWVEDDGKSGGMRFAEISQEFRADLTRWLQQDGAGQMPGREALPAAATPLDTMERIRQEIRSGYPQRPTQHSSEPSVEQAAKADTSRGKATNPQAKPKRKPEAASPQEKPQPVREETKPTPIASPAMPQVAENLIGSRLFSARPTYIPQEEIKPFNGASAFLKPPQDAKTARPSDNLSAVRLPVTDNAGRPLAPEGSKTNISQPAVLTATPTRPHIPPLEESFESAWENAKLSVPPDTPHLSRAAAGGIIALALAVILGAVAYNFRQDIGDVFVQMGHSISGDSRSATVPAEPVNNPEPRADDPQQAQSAKEPPAAGSDHQPASGISGSAADNHSNPASAPTAGNLNSSPKAPETTAVVSQENADTKAAAPDPDSGEEEFNTARDILRGPNRPAEMSKAVDLLWAGVRKGYVPAEVTLADLFRRGDGVDQSCAQAKVLLVAASKKGSTDAKQMLRLMTESGCD